MNRIRRHRWRKSISLIAIVALAWTQIALASHPACTPSTLGGLPDHAYYVSTLPADTETAPCHGVPAGDESPLCESHCSQGDLSKDAFQPLYVPSLGHSPMLKVADTRQLHSASRDAMGAHPPAKCHRPTLHPASLLLI
jgi:hypothetical protein